MHHPGSDETDVGVGLPYWNCFLNSVRTLLRSSIPCFTTMNDPCRVEQCEISRFTSGEPTAAYDFEHEDLGPATLCQVATD